MKEKSPQWTFFQNRSPLGRIDLIQCEPKINVINMCAQDNISAPHHGCRLSYTHLMECMLQVKLMVPTTPNIWIYAPKFGSGIAGGNWDVIDKLIHEIWYQHNVKIFYL